MLTPVGRWRGRAVLVVGVFLVVAAVYGLGAHGRIDSIDGQIRFDATSSWLSTGRPLLRDARLLHFGAAGRDGRLYSPYGPAPSLASVPLVALVDPVRDPLGERRRFLFSLTGVFFGAALASLMLLFFLELGVAPRAAAGWALAAAFATFLWPGAATVLDQGQHAFWALLSVLLAFVASKRASVAFALAGGLAAGILVLYQVPYLMHLPILACVAAGGSDAGGSTRRGRFVVFIAAGALVAALLPALNLRLFGLLLNPGSVIAGSHPPPLGNPIVGVAGLLLSPGKGIVFYCPVILLAIAGWPLLRRLQARLAWTIVSVSVLHVLFIGSLSIWHSDWCWGPRYLTVLVPLWCLGLPFAPVGKAVRGALLVLGVLVNLLGITLVHERYFYERGFETYFWWRDPGVYWRSSPILARVGDLVEVVSEGMPAEARAYAPAPAPGVLTYFLMQPGELQPAPPRWLREYGIFWLPRPWPLWMPAAAARGWAPAGLPVPVALTATGVALSGLAGCWLLALALRRAGRTSSGEATGGG